MELSKDEWIERRAIEILATLDRLDRLELPLSRLLSLGGAQPGTQAGTQPSAEGLATAKDEVRLNIAALERLIRTGRVMLWVVDQWVEHGAAPPEGALGRAVQVAGHDVYGEPVVSRTP